MSLSVQEMLQHPSFTNASILAGKNGLHREINWTHVIEIERFGHLLNGNEMILTTGIGWTDSEEKSLAFLQQLLDHDAAALCIELVVHAKILPRKMLEVAEAHNFPIISFQEEVKFIDIMMDLHEQILGSHEEIWIDLEAFHQKLNHSLTTDGAIGDFLRLLHQETNKTIALEYDDQFRFFPSPPKSRQEKLVEAMKHKADFYAHPIYLLNEQIGTLAFLEPMGAISRFDELALKRCSEIINQYFWRHHQQMEVQQMERNKWILDAIEQPTSHEEAVKMIHRDFPNVVIHDAIIGIKPEKKSLLTKDKQRISETRFMMAFRSALFQYGLELFTVHDERHDRYILFIMAGQADTLLPRIKHALQFLAQKRDDNFKKEDLQWVSFGKVFDNYSEIRRSYQAALSTLTYQQKHGILTEPFYNQLGVYRLIDQMEDKREITDIITDYIEPLMKHDKEKGTELVKTLHVYLQCLGQKNETAQDLHIVRQTLYHRLNKIEQLLGTDYMMPANRFMIEFALHALEFN